MQKKGGRCFASAILASVIAAMLWATGASAAAMVADLEGDVRVAAPGADGTAIAPGQRLDSGSVVTTGPGSRVILRFDDGLWAALHESTEFRIDDFRYRPQDPTADRAAFALLRGALRIVTGALGHRTPSAFSLRTSTMTIGVRGTDFMVAIAKPTCLSVLQGTVAATNDGGTATFSAGDLGAAASDATLTAAIRADALPAAVSSAFSGLGALHLAPRASSDAAGRGEMPKGARLPEAAGFGQDTAARARELKDEVRRNPGRGTADTVLERIREIGSKPGAK